MDSVLSDLTMIVQDHDSRNGDPGCKDLCNHEVHPGRLQEPVNHHAEAQRRAGDRQRGERFPNQKA
jgi:hypothetical protein